MIGSDFEQFLKVKGDIIPVTAELDLGDKFGTHVQLSQGTMHRDNVMVELCSKPASSASEFADNCTALSQEAVDYLTQGRGLEGVELVARPICQFGTKELMSETAQEIGCDVDYLAEAGQSIERERVSVDALANIRCAGGHIHISYGCTDKVPEPVAATFCDVALGGLELQMGSQGQRRKFYGLAGLHRRKQYGSVGGVEYRTTSNLWLQKRGWAYAMGHNALRLEWLFKNHTKERIGHVWETMLKDRWINKVIEEERTANATALIRRMNALVPDLDLITGV